MSRLPIYLVLLLQVAILVLGGLYWYRQQTKTTVAYLRTDYLINNYTAFKQEKAAFEHELSAVNNRIDSLSRQLGYLQKLQASTPLEETRLKSLVNTTNAQYERLAQYANEQTAAKEKELAEKMYDKVNLAINKYARDKGIDIVIGNTPDNLVYGNPQTDITEDVLQQLNNEKVTEK